MKPLQICGCEVCSFNDPILAYDHIRDNPDKYSLIIKDYRMPQMDGLFFATKLAEINKKIEHDHNGEWSWWHKM